MDAAQDLKIRDLSGRNNRQLRQIDSKVPKYIYKKLRKGDPVTDFKSCQLRNIHGEVNSRGRRKTCGAKGTKSSNINCTRHNAAHSNNTRLGGLDDV
ncbi:hypothetical protein Tco_1540589 [Tanacetum coccineum]